MITCFFVIVPRIPARVPLVTIPARDPCNPHPRTHRYRDVDEDDSDMEADFSTLMSEEARSARLAAQEDEQEFRKEMEHKKRKMAMKKRAMTGR